MTMNTFIFFDAFIKIQGLKRSNNEILLASAHRRRGTVLGKVVSLFPCQKEEAH